MLKKVSQPELRSTSLLSTYTKNLHNFLSYPNSDQSIVQALMNAPSEEFERKILEMNQDLLKKQQRLLAEHHAAESFIQQAEKKIKLAYLTLHPSNSLAIETLAQEDPPRLYSNFSYAVLKDFSYLLREHFLKPYQNQLESLFYELNLNRIKLGACLYGGPSNLTLSSSDYKRKEVPSLQQQTVGDPQAEQIKEALNKNVQPNSSQNLSSFEDCVLLFLKELCALGEMDQLDMETQEYLANTVKVSPYDERQTKFRETLSNQALEKSRKLEEKVTLLTFFKKQLSNSKPLVTKKQKIRRINRLATVWQGRLQTGSIQKPACDLKIRSLPGLYQLINTLIEERAAIARGEKWFQCY